MRSAPRRRATAHHLSVERALALPPKLDFHWPTAEIERIIAAQVVLVLPYRGFDQRDHLGQLVVHRGIAEAVKEIFERLFAAAFPIGCMVPISAFDWDDDRSMAANNCVGFHLRKKTGLAEKAELSWHAYGLAIDINPLQNPYVKDGIVLPSGAQRYPFQHGTCDEYSLPVRLFKERGFAWGGEWSSLKDYMHFEHPLSP